MSDVVFDVGGDGSDGIGIRRIVEIEGSTEEVMHAVGYDELNWRCGIACDFVEDAVNFHFGILERMFDYGISPDGVFVNEISAIFAQGTEVCIYRRVVAVDASVEGGIDDVDPFAFAIASLPVDHLSGSGHFERTGRIDAVEGPIFVRRQVDTKISIGFRRIVGARDEQKRGEDECQEIFH